MPATDPPRDEEALIELGSESDPNNDGVVPGDRVHDAADDPAADGDGVGDDARAPRAREEEMTVHALRDDRYAVETAGGSGRVDLLAARCTSPDHTIRGALCKHLRRVAIEVTAGRVAPPDHRRAACAVCGDPVFVPVGGREARSRAVGDDDRLRDGDEGTNGGDVDAAASA